MVRRFSDETGRWGYTLKAYLALVDCAKNRQTITYGRLAELTDDHAQGVGGRHLNRIAAFCDAHQLPPLACLVVNSETGAPGGGYGDLATLSLDRERVYRHPWSEFAPPTIDDLRGE